MPKYLKDDRQEIMIRAREIEKNQVRPPILKNYARITQEWADAMPSLEGEELPAPKPEPKGKKLLCLKGAL